MSVNPKLNKPVKLAIAYGVQQMIDGCEPVSEAESEQVSRPKMYGAGHP